MISLFRKNSLKLAPMNNLKQTASVLLRSDAKKIAGKLADYTHKYMAQELIETHDDQKIILARFQFVEKVEKHRSMIIDFVEDYETTLRNLAENKKTCENLKNNDFDLNNLPENGLTFGPYKPIEYFLNKCKDMEEYVTDKITKSNKKFVYRLKKYQNNDDNKKNSAFQRKETNEDIRIYDFTQNQKDKIDDTTILKGSIKSAENAFTTPRRSRINKKRQHY